MYIIDVKFNQVTKESGKLQLTFNTRGQAKAVYEALKLTKPELLKVSQSGEVKFDE